MEAAVLKCILRYDFYTENKHRVNKTLFEDEFRELYDIIVDAHDKNQQDLSIDEIFGLWKVKNPTATRAEVRSMEEVITLIQKEQNLTPEVAAEILKGLWTQDVGKKIANLGIAISEGKQEAFTKLYDLIASIKDGVMPDDFGEEITKDLEELLQFTDNTNRYKFNIPGLAKFLYGIGKKEFGVIFALPETGKTAFVVTLACGPFGFCEQGAKVLYLGNEEDPKRTMLRAYQSFTGFTKEEIVKHPQQAIKQFEKIKANITMMEATGFSITEVEAVIDKLKPDVVIIDQYDKIKIEGNFDGQNYQRLRELYTSLREIAKRQDVAMLGLSQASNEASGRTILSLDMMEGSKIGKAAETDIVIGIAALAADQNGVDPIRYLNVLKNKISGWHGVVTAKLDGEISRYTD